MRDTQQAAFVDAKAKAKPVRELCKIALAHRGPSTADEIADTIGMSILTVRPRVTEMGHRNDIEDTGLRRKNKSGKEAIVWRLAA